ncbi:MAG: hypothetical protein IKI37_04770, partial [Oscillospiraceae bacterium]|nr:hypothetical protein [Oscillospiraceae bacterium]
MQKFSFKHKTHEKFYYYRGKCLKILMHGLLHIRLLFRWTVLSLILGCVLGVIGTEFVKSISWSTKFRETHLWCYALLPVGGLLIIFLYRVTHD